VAVDENGTPVSNPFVGGGTANPFLSI
jgi:hypothetical protein